MKSQKPITDAEGNAFTAGCITGLGACFVIAATIGISSCSFSSCSSPSKPSSTVASIETSTFFVVARQENTTHGTVIVFRAPDGEVHARLAHDEAEVAVARPGAVASFLVKDGRILWDRKALAWREPIAPERNDR